MRRFFGPIGYVSRLSIDSQALKHNLLGDPAVRAVDVYVAAGHDGRGLPLLVDLVGFTSSGLSQTNWVGFRENVPERLDRLIGEQRLPPVRGVDPGARRRRIPAPRGSETRSWFGIAGNLAHVSPERLTGCVFFSRRSAIARITGGIMVLYV